MKFSTASGVEASNLRADRRLIIPGPRSLPRQSPRDRVRPLWRSPRRWMDPYRPAVMNSVAKRNGALIRVAGHLVPRCECCEPCPCPIPPDGNGYGCCGACTPRTWLAIVDGVLLCDCTGFFFYPPNEVWGHALGVADGAYCLTFDNDALQEAAHPFCSWGSYVPSLSSAFTWTLATCNNPPQCCDVVTDSSRAATIVAGLDFDGIFVRIECHGTGVVGGRAESTVFFDTLPLDGCNKAYVFQNRVGCGDNGPSPIELGIGHSGTVTLIPCCP